MEKEAVSDALQSLMLQVIGLRDEAAESGDDLQYARYAHASTVLTELTQVDAEGQLSILAATL